MSTVRLFLHSDPGAPALNGLVGSLTALLRKCLVGDAGIAYGASASSGWSEKFIGAASNIAAFQSGDGGCVVLVNDNAPGAGGAKESSIKVYASMTAIDTGVSPTATIYFRKSEGSDSTAFPWMVVADDSTAWIHAYGRPVAGNANVAGFGKFNSLDSASAYQYFALGRHVANQTVGGHESLSNRVASSKSFTDSLTVGPPTGIGAGVRAGIVGQLPGSVDAAAFGSNTMPAGPHPVTGEYYFNSNPLIVGATYPIGRLRGLAVPLQYHAAGESGVVIPGSGLRTMRFNSLDASIEGYYGRVAVDCVGPW